MEQERIHETQKTNLMQLWHNYQKAVRSYWWVLVIFCVLFALLLPLGLGLIRKPQYQASCTMTVKVVSNSVTGELNSQYGIYYDKDLAEQLEATFTYILTSDYLTDRVAQTLGENAKLGRVMANCIAGSNMFEVHALGDTPEQALATLTAVIDVFPDAARYVVGDLKMDMVEEPEADEKPANAVNWTWTPFLGAAVGFLVGSAALILSVWTHRTVRKPEDLEELLNMPCLGVVPRSESQNGEFRESFQGVARKVERAIEGKNGHVLLVTGTLPGEGKTTVAQKLAETLAGWGKQVCLVDGDLRKPSLYRNYGLQKKVLPLAGYLRGKADRDAVFRDVGVDNLLLVGNSLPVEHPTELLDSPAMKALLSQVSQMAELVIVDAPPCDALSDVTVLQRYADWILYVVRQDYAPVPRILDAVEDLCDRSEKLLGYVFNYTTKTVSGYGKYGYGAYSYGKYGNGYYGKYGHYGSAYYRQAQTEETSEK